MSFPIQSTIDALRADLGNLTPISNSVHDFLNRGGGNAIEKTITLSASGATASENIFQVTGSCYVLRFYGEIMDATAFTTCTAASIDLFPTGGAAVQISAATGVLSGMAVGTYFFKTGLKTDAFTIANSVAAQVTEQTYEGSDVFNAFVLTQKLSTDTFIRFTYTTADTPINAQIKFYIEYRGLNGGGIVVV